MTTFLLVRHGAVRAPGDVLLGRTSEAGLTTEGKEQAVRLAHHLRRLPLVGIYSSPLTRALETAAPISRELNLPVWVSQSLNEVDYGRWTGCNFNDLQSDRRWQQYNTLRSGCQIPAGENIAEVEHRVAGQLQLWTAHHPGALIAAITHAEIIRIALLQTLGLSSDFFNRIEPAIGLVSAVQWDGDQNRVLCINDSGALEILTITA